MKNLNHTTISNKSEIKIPDFSTIKAPTKYSNTSIVETPKQKANREHKQNKEQTFKTLSKVHEFAAKVSSTFFNVVKEHVASGGTVNKELLHDIYNKRLLKSLSSTFDARDKSRREIGDWTLNLYESAVKRAVGMSKYPSNETVTKFFTRKNESLAKKGSLMRWIEVIPYNFDKENKRVTSLGEWKLMEQVVNTEVSSEDIGATDSLTAKKPKAKKVVTEKVS